MCCESCKKRCNTPPAATTLTKAERNPDHVHDDFSRSADAGAGVLSFFTGWRIATRLIVDECQRFGGFFSGSKEFRCISTMQMWLMHESPNKRVYIAGPMSGLPDNNYPAFNESAERLRNKGWHVENPAENPNPHTAAACEWTAYMRMGVSQLMTCHAIYMLPGWLARIKGCKP